jgi:predicted O-linked N-acetylglucosamine transferase (SPINDLY family)
MSDRIVAPAEYRRHYAESFVYLPGTYYGAGHHTFAPHNTPKAPPKPAQGSGGERGGSLVSREGYEGVPEGVPMRGLVFGAFSNLAKVNEGVWRVWCRVLATVPELVLWSIQEPAFGVPNLVNFALQQGVKKTQLVFTPRIQRADHMRVKAAAALYFDTWPFNGHSTSVEALWEGLPVLTLPDVRMAGRVGASVVRAAGEGHRMIARNDMDYIALAQAMASSRRGLKFVERVRSDLLLRRSSGVCEREREGGGMREPEPDAGKSYVRM